MNETKPWVTAELIDTERRVSEAGSYFHVDFDLTLATCQQRDELVEALKRIHAELDRPGELMSGVLRACKESRAVLAKWGAS